MNSIVWVWWVERNRCSRFPTIQSVPRVMTAATVARGPNPLPHAMPMMAVVHREAAVVRPFTDDPYLTIAPAPRNPRPFTTWATMRPGSPPEGSSAVE